MSVSDCMFSLSSHIVSDRKTVECVEKLIVMCVCVCVCVCERLRACVTDKVSAL